MSCVLVVEDVVTTGKSTKETMLVAEQAGATVVGAASIVESTLASRATAEEPPVDAASESAPASAEAAPYDATQESTHGLETAQAMLDDLTP